MNNEERLLAPSFNDIDLDTIDDTISQSDVEEAERRAKQGASKAPAGSWFPGDGVSYFRLLQFFNPEKKKLIGDVTRLGDWDLIVTWATHQDFVPGSSILCVRETWGEPCDICDTRFRLGRDVFKDYKNPFLKEKGLYTRTKGAFNIQLIQDCKSRGDQKFPRPEYINGKVYWASCPFNGVKNLFEAMKNPDYVGGPPLWSPISGRVFRYEIGKNEGGFRQHKVEARATERWAGPLVPLPDLVKGYQGLKRDDVAIKAVMAQAYDLSKMRVKPTDDERKAIKMKLVELEDEAKRMVGMTTYHSPVQSPKADIVIGPQSGVASAASPSATSASVQAGSFPTELTDGNGVKLCFGKAYDADNIFCQICPEREQCLAKINS